MNTKNLILAAAAVLSLSGIANAAGNPAVKNMMEKSDCFTCHAVDNKLVGPSYKEVAGRYHGSKASAVTVAMLAQKIIKGGNGNWNQETGGVPMTPHPQLTMAQAKAMVKWVLAQ